MFGFSYLPFRNRPKASTHASRDGRLSPFSTASLVMAMNDRQREITLIAPKTAARMLGISKDTLRKYSQRPDGPRRLVFSNHLHRYDEDDIRRFASRMRESFEGGAAAAA